MTLFEKVLRYCNEKSDDTEEGEIYHQIVMLLLLLEQLEEKNKRKELIKVHKSTGIYYMCPRCKCSVKDDSPYCRMCGQAIK